MLNFSEALDAVKQGCKIWRLGWNGKGTQIKKNRQLRQTNSASTEDWLKATKNIKIIAYTPDAEVNIEQPRNKPLSLHPLTVEEIVDGMLQTPPMPKNKKSALIKHK